MKVCECGNEFKEAKFGEGNRMCRSCVSNRRRWIMKIKAIEYLGGKCKICEYEGCVESFDFHHTDPSKKDFTLSGRLSYSWERIKNELDKCDLLCANCHRELHWNEKKERSQYKYDYEIVWHGKVDRCCELCGKSFEVNPASKQVYCSPKCARGSYTKIEWPPVAILVDDIRCSSFSQVSRQLGISDNAIRKHLVKNGIEPKSVRSIKDNKFC